MEVKMGFEMSLRIETPEGEEIQNDEGYYGILPSLEGAPIPPVGSTIMIDRYLPSERRFKVLDCIFEYDKPRPYGDDEHSYGVVLVVEEENIEDSDKDK